METGKPCDGQLFSWEQDTQEYDLADLQAALRQTPVEQPEPVPEPLQYVSPAYQKQLGELATSLMAHWRERQGRLF